MTHRDDNTTTEGRGGHTMWHAQVRENENTGRTGGFGIGGTLARPEPAPVEISEDGPLNGLEEFIEWDSIEDALSKGKYAYKSEFKDEIRRQFEEAGVEFTRPLYESAVAGLFPEARDIYRDLPAAPPHASVTTAKLTADVVRDIRARAAAGEKALHLAKEYGVRHNTVSDLINYKTWRNVA